MDPRNLPTHTQYRGRLTYSLTSLGWCADIEVDAPDDPAYLRAADIAVTQLADALAQLAGADTSDGLAA